MTERKGSLYFKDWLKVARQDWHRIFVMLADDDGEGAGLFLQQALEKYLKAFLLKEGWKLKKIHTLQSLLDDAATFGPRLVQFRPICERVSGFYIVERYPSLGGEELESSAVQRELPQARALIQALFSEEPLE